MSSADNPTKSSVVTSDANANVPGAHRPHFKSRLFLILAVVIIVFAAAGGGYYVWRARQHKTPTAALATMSQSALNTAEEQANNGDANAALSTLNSAIKNTTDKSQKAALYIQQGATYTDEQNYSAALNSFLQAEQTNGLTYGLAQSIAEAAQASGNKQLAITYYQKAIGLIPANDSTGGPEKNTFQASINQLEGK